MPAGATETEIEASGLLAPILGHVGDGNFHLSLLVDLDDPDEVRRADGLCQRLIDDVGDAVDQSHRFGLSSRQRPGVDRRGDFLLRQLPRFGDRRDDLLVEIVEDLLVAAHADARRKLETTLQEKMQALTGGLPLPPGLKLF